MLNLFTDEMRRDPYPLYAQLRSSSPVFQPPGTDLWMIFDHDGVKRALHDSDAFSSVVTPPTGKAPDWLIFSDPPRHTRLRSIILRAFTPRSIAGLEPRVRELSRGLLDETIARDEMDLVADYASLLPTLVIAEMLGVPLADRAKIVRWSEVIMSLGHSVNGGEEAARAISANAVVKEEMRAYLAILLDERRRDPKDDLLTRLVEAEIEGEKLTEQDLLGFFQLLLAAGTETTTNVISNGILCLLENPGELGRLRAEPGLLPSAIEEIVRYRSPAQIMFRTSKRDLEMSGKTIPAGKLVLAMIGSANRDPAHFHEANRFDVARNPNPHIGFGHGLHFCIGAALARLEARIALGDLLEKTRSFELSSQEPWEPRKALTVHGPASLPIRFKRSA